MASKSSGGAGRVQIQASSGISSQSAASAAIQAAAAGGAAQTVSVRSAPPSTVFVELGQAAQTAQIARDGVGVAQVPLNNDAINALIAGRPQLVTRVVT